MINTWIFKAVLVTLGKWQYVLSKFYFSIYNLWWTDKVPFILVLEFWKNLIYKISVDRALCSWMFVCKRSSYVSINKFCLSRLAVIFFPVIRSISDIKDHCTCKPTHHRKSSFSGSPLCEAVILPKSYPAIAREQFLTGWRRLLHCWSNFLGNTLAEVSSYIEITKNCFDMKGLFPQGQTCQYYLGGKRWSSHSLVSAICKPRWKYLRLQRVKIFTMANLLYQLCWLKQIILDAAPQFL